VKGRSLFITMPLTQLDPSPALILIDLQKMTEAVLSQLQEQARLTNVAVHQ
jgi:hypothetical protein